MPSDLASIPAVRSLTIEDAEAVYQILLKSPATPGVPVWSYPSVEESLRQYMGVGADDDAGLAAFILYRDLPGSREILHLASSERIRRKGWMEALLGDLAHAHEPGIELWLEVHADNKAARRLYEKLGFSVVGERPRYYADGRTAILYNLR